VPNKAGFDIEGDLALYGISKFVGLHSTTKLGEPVKDPYGNLRMGTINCSGVWHEARAERSRIPELRSPDQRAERNTTHKKMSAYYFTAMG
jgi:hypothetical protein